MKISIVTELLENRIYDIEIKNGNILISDKNGQNVIPLSELRHFGLEGRGKQLKHFVMETDGKVYEGNFLSSEDAGAFADSIRKFCRCNVDIRIDSFEEK